MPIHTDPVEYLDPSSTLYKDIRRLAPRTPGLGVTHFWLRGPVGSVAEPEVLTALHHFQQEVEADPDHERHQWADG